MEEFLFIIEYYCPGIEYDRGPCVVGAHCSLCSVASIIFSIRIIFIFFASFRFHHVHIWSGHALHTYTWSMGNGRFDSTSSPFTNTTSIHNKWMQSKNGMNKNGVCLCRHTVISTTSASQRHRRTKMMTFLAACIIIYLSIVCINDRKTHVHVLHSNK